jgi:hypothetical protein
VLRQKGIVLSIRCDENCGFTASGQLRIAGSRKRYGLRAASNLTTAGRRTRVRLALSSTAAKGLQRAGRGSAAITVVARDAAGNATTARVGIRARR